MFLPSVDRSDATCESRKQRKGGKGLSSCPWHCIENPYTQHCTQATPLPPTQLPPVPTPPLPPPLPSPAHVRPVTTAFKRTWSIGCGRHGCTQACLYTCTACCIGAEVAGFHSEGGVGDVDAGSSSCKVALDGGVDQASSTALRERQCPSLAVGGIVASESAFLHGRCAHAHAVVCDPVRSCRCALRPWELLRVESVMSLVRFGV